MHSAVYPGSKALNQTNNTLAAYEIRTLNKLNMQMYSLIHAFVELCCHEKLTVPPLRMGFAQTTADIASISHQHSHNNINISTKSLHLLYHFLFPKNADRKITRRTVQTTPNNTYHPINLKHQLNFIVKTCKIFEKLDPFQMLNTRDNFCRKPYIK